MPQTSAEGVICAALDRFAAVQPMAGRTDMRWSFRKAGIMTPPSMIIAGHPGTGRSPLLARLRALGADYTALVGKPGRLNA